jgi:hypothetical protein
VTKEEEEEAKTTGPLLVLLTPTIYSDVVALESRPRKKCIIHQSSQHDVLCFYCAMMPIVDDVHLFIFCPFFTN